MRKEFKKMFLHNKVLSTIGMAAVTVALLGAVDSASLSKATTLATERSMAGISLSLDKYYATLAEERLARNTTAAAIQDTIGTDTDSETAVSVTPSAIEAVNTDEQTEEEMEREAEAKEKPMDVKDMISNLNYGRLGIASVDNYLNIRKKPDESSTIVGKLPKDAGCHIYKIQDGWAKIISNHVEGWVSADFLVTDEKAEKLALEVGKRMATVKEETLRVRFLPSTDSSVYTLVPINEDLTVVNENLTEKYVNKIIGNFKKDEKFLIENVKDKEMMADLDNWICVKLNGERVFVSKDCVETSYQLKKAVAIDEDSYSSEKTGISSTRSDMVSFALQYLGNPYVWGGTSLTNGADCSGFVMGIYGHFGYGLPRTSAAQANYMTGISYSEIQPGDLIFYGNGYSVSHVAMYIGNGQIIHAMDENNGIRISNANYMTPMKIGRIIN